MYFQFIQDGERQDAEREPVRGRDHVDAAGLLLPLHPVAQRDLQALLHLLPPLLLRRQRVMPLPRLGGRAKLQANLQG